jgi:hypothetical protein
MKLLSYKAVGEFEQAIIDASEGISISDLTIILPVWRKRLYQCINNGENYVEQILSSDSICLTLYLRDVRDPGAFMDTGD